MKDPSISRLILLPVSAIIILSCSLYLPPSVFAANIEGTIDGAVGQSLAVVASLAFSSHDSTQDVPTTTAVLDKVQNSGESTTIASSQIVSEREGPTTVLGSVLGFIVPDSSTRTSLEEGIGVSLPWCVIVLFVWSVIATVGWGVSRCRVRPSTHLNEDKGNHFAPPVGMVPEMEYKGKHDGSAAYEAQPLSIFDIAEDVSPEIHNLKDATTAGEGAKAAVFMCSDDEQTAAPFEVEESALEDVISEGVIMKPIEVESVVNEDPAVIESISTAVTLQGVALESEGMLPDFSAARAIPVPFIAQAGFNLFVPRENPETRSTGNPLLHSQNLFATLPDIKEPAPAFEPEPAATGEIALVKSSDECDGSFVDKVRLDATIASPRLPIMSPDLARLLAEAHTNGKVVDLPVCNHRMERAEPFSPVDAGRDMADDGSRRAADPSVSSQVAPILLRPLVLRPIEEVESEWTHAVGESYSSHVALDRLIAQLEADSECMRRMPNL